MATRYTCLFCYFIFLKSIMVFDTIWDFHVDRCNVNPDLQKDGLETKIQEQLGSATK